MLVPITVPYRHLTVTESVALPPNAGGSIMPEAYSHACPSLLPIQRPRCSEVRYVMEKVPGRDMWAVIDTVTHRPALVNDVPQIDLGLDDADDLTDLLNRLDREASVSAKH
jgi:hypothetical protein